MLAKLLTGELPGTTAEQGKEGRAPNNGGAASGAGEETARQENWIQVGPLAAAILARIKQSREIATAAE